MSDKKVNLALRSNEMTEREIETLRDLLFTLHENVIGHFDQMDDCDEQIRMLVVDNILPKVEIDFDKAKKRIEMIDAGLI